MNSSFFTNLMLIVIAVLLLVMVIQNGMQSSGPSYSPSVSQRPVNPHSRPMSSRPPSGALMGAEMFFSALKGFPDGCDSSKLLVECNSAEAQAVKEQIAQFAQGKGPRQVFDFIIETWGEDVLSDQAKRIRQQVRGQ